MAEPFVVYGASTSGSVPIEATLSLLNLPYRVEDHAPWEGSHEAERLARINALRQVPALALPTGELMTESAAILIWLADSHPEARLAPALTDATRPAFLRWMTFVSSAIYALYWVADDPSRVVDRAEDHATVKARLYERIAHCWEQMGAQLQPGRYLLGEELSVLDLYVATASRWSPGRSRFYDVAPGLADTIRRVDADPRLAALWAERFPFTPGWER
ncbi:MULTISPECIES: glutathione S-transferase family protein [unclassified Ensifer]|uniref:glutathione S-transferase family protein n=1 Tax=unclassified Ensifer TaxID=2633371 RepID=UPI000813522D|nr:MULTISPECIES: glutathione S-transferase family protein [unclassified Ensifer]OCP00759.1 glutathione S-transferase [Ensifer sp. LC14]OCP04617.1 glutathione S-transferase [Ensifer sp. LC11]OCP09670.1 glutathione S-transferase [Ensifer sp. LC13]OCP30716.1 glutathione S-transferase [Ensifer sp. LC499]